MTKKIAMIAAVALLSVGMTTTSFAQSSRPSRDRGPISVPATKDKAKAEVKEHASHEGHDHGEAGAMGEMDMSMMAPPAEVAEYIAGLAGDWEGEGWMTVAPGMPKIPAKATDSSEMFGFWLVTNSEISYEEELMPGTGTEFKGRATLGWDMSEQKVVSSWIDDMMPAMYLSKGEVEGNKLVMHMSFKDPASGMEVPHTMTYTMKGKDAFTLEMSMIAEGQSIPMMYWDYTRK